MKSIASFAVATLLCLPAIAGDDVAHEAWHLRIDGDIQGAKALLEKHVAEHPDDGPAQFELARVGFLTATETRPPDLKDPQQAIEAAIKADPGNAQYRFWAGTIATYHGISKAHKITSMPGLPGQLKQAIRHFKKAVEIDPAYHEARLALFGCYDRLPWALGGSERKAKAELASLLELDPVYGTEAECEKLPRKTDEEKVALWEACIDAHPERADAHARLAELLVRTETSADGLSRAGEHARRARTLDPKETCALLRLAEAYTKAGELDKAEAAAREYLDGDPPAAQARAWGLEVLERIARERGDSEQAEAYAQEARALNPGGFRPKLPMDELFGAP